MLGKCAAGDSALHAKHHCHIPQMAHLKDIPQSRNNNSNNTTQESRYDKVIVTCRYTTDLCWILLNTSFPITRKSIYR